MNEDTTGPVRKPRFHFWKLALYIFLFGSLLLNVILCGFLGFRQNPEREDLLETRLWGDEEARDKVAVIRIEGVLMEGMTHYAMRQIESAAKDDRVKAVVLRIDSPGGTVSASEELYQALIRLRDGKVLKFPGKPAKKLVVSMGSIAASGGYYIAMPAEVIVADPISITGSIGVYASLPNVAELINRNGIKFELVKAGGIKAGGSPFHELTPQEREPWQEMVNSSYDHFLGVVAAGRPRLTREQLRSEVVVQKWIDRRDDKGNLIYHWYGIPKQVEYVRYRCDGGTFTAAEALQFGLIDEIGVLDAAVVKAASMSGLTSYRVVGYEKTPTFLNMLLGTEQERARADLSLSRLSELTSPRLWYLAPQADLTALLAAGAAHP